MKKKIIWTIVAILVLLLVIPQSVSNPEEKRTKRDDASKIFYVNPVLALEGEQIW